MDLCISSPLRSSFEDFSFPLTSLERDTGDCCPFIENISALLYLDEKRVLMKMT